MQWNRWAAVVALKAFAVLPLCASLSWFCVGQVKEVMSDMPRLLKRTHLKRSEYKILGDVPTPKSNDAEEQRDSHPNQHDTEVFDDTDFYERLLQELIDTGSQGSC